MVEGLSKPMGVKSAFGWEPDAAARAWLTSADDLGRRRLQQYRRRLYEDDSESSIRKVITDTFTDETVRSRTMLFSRLARSVSLFRRVTNERANTVYMVPPTRVVTPAGGQAAFKALLAETNYDDVCDRWLRCALASTAAFAFPRYVQRLNRIVIDVIPADAVTAIPDPDDPCVAAALIYDRCVYKSDGTSVTWRVYWDDEVTFTMDENLVVVAVSEGERIRQHSLGRLPIAALHMAPRHGSYWNVNYGWSLVAANESCSLLTTLAMRKLKARGFAPVVISGDVRGFPKGQPWDEEGGIVAPDGTTLSVLQSEGDAKNYLDLVDAVETRAAAEYGISRQRLNQDGARDVKNEVGLLEQRADMVKIMARAEQDLFEIVKLVSQESPDPAKRLPEDATVVVDFGEYLFRTDPLQELDVWERKRKAGVANILDQIKSENPEIRTDDEAWAEFERNCEAEAKYVEMRRALNVSADANMAEPGQSPEQNGAMGPMVRDGQMTRDQAAVDATGGEYAAPSTTT